MNFINRRLFSRVRKKKKKEAENELDVKQGVKEEEQNGVSVCVDRHQHGNGIGNEEVEDDDDDDDDFFNGNIKRRLKEIRKNSSMGLIPEEDVYNEETNSGELPQPVRGDDAAGFTFGKEEYDRYCERMLIFDRMASDHVRAGGASAQLPRRLHRSVSKKLVTTFYHLSLKKPDQFDAAEHLRKQEHDPLFDLETAYVGHLCLTWEALQCQYRQLRQQIMSSELQYLPFYDNDAQQFQQFLVLLQRFMENEPFEMGVRPEIYARARVSMPKLLQVPSIQGLGANEVTEDSMVSASYVLKIMEDSTLAFRRFLKMDKKKSGSRLNVASPHNHVAATPCWIKNDLEKKKLKLKELHRKKKGWKKTLWPESAEEVEILLGLIDVKVVLRVLRMLIITKEQLQWCEEKTWKLDFPRGKFQWDASTSLFPC